MKSLVADKTLTRLASWAVIAGVVTVFWSLNLRLVDISRLPEKYDDIIKAQHRLEEKQDTMAKNVRLVANSLGVKLIDDSAPVGHEKPVAPIEMFAVVPDKR